MHELGHTLRLDHRTDSGTVMKSSITTTTSLNAKDRDHLTYAIVNIHM